MYKKMLTLIVVLAIGPAAKAQTAGMQSFQGRLKQNGTPVSGNVTLQFRIFDAQTNGNLVDMDGDGTPEDVVGQDVTERSLTGVVDGLVSTKFGPVHPKAFDGSARWLEVTVNPPSTPLPRLEMATAPAAAEQLNAPATGNGVVFVNGDGSVIVSAVGQNNKIGVQGVSGVEKATLTSSTAVSPAGSGGAALELRDTSNGLRALLRGFETGNTPSSAMRLYNHTGQERVNIEGGINPSCGGCTDTGGALQFQSADGLPTLFSKGGAAGGGAFLSLANGLTNPSNLVTITLAGNGLGNSGEMEVKSGRVENPASQSLVRLRGDIGTAAGAQVQLLREDGQLGVNIQSGPDSVIELRDGSNTETLVARASDNGTGGAKVSLFNGQATNRETITLDGKDTIWESSIALQNTAGANTFDLYAQNNDIPPTDGARLILRTSAEENTVDLFADGGSGGGRISIRNGQPINHETISLEAYGGPGGRISLLNGMGGNQQTITLDGNNGAGHSRVILRDSNGDIGIVLQGDDGTACFDGTITQTGGCDVAESFELSDRKKTTPGMVLVLDEMRPGHLKLCIRAYDKKVAGIVSGAGGLQPGVKLGSRLDGSDDLPIALSGRVYCCVDATKNAVEIGDLLTTSDTPGHAMKVTDFTRSQGAALGKAMEPLAKGKKGLVLVLVSLQ